MTAATENGQKCRDQFVGPKLVIVMVGLPARGKSYISRKLARYLCWLQFETRVFNVGETRRKTQQKEDGVLQHPAQFFDPSNTDGVLKREQIAMETLDSLLDWLGEGKACVGILDATNSTTQRRQSIMHRLQKREVENLDVLFLESSCEDPIIIEKNILLKLSGPDYCRQARDVSLLDFRRRIELYKKSYVPLGTDAIEKDLPYLKIMDVGRQIIANSINGYLSAVATEYLLNFRLHDRQIWITRNGESLDDTQGIIGRDSILSTSGSRYAGALVQFISEARIAWEASRDARKGTFETDQQAYTDQPGNARSLGDQYPFHIWTSTMTQAHETAREFERRDYNVVPVRMLKDLHPGDMEGLTFTEIWAKYPEVMAARQANPIHYRWPGLAGESYADVIHRLRPIINELERSISHVLLVTHRAVARVLLAYFQNLCWDSITDIDVPPGRVFSVEVVCAISYSANRTELIDCVDRDPME